ncbi:unnamed protein product [Laminaria digitata]
MATHMQDTGATLNGARWMRVKKKNIRNGYIYFRNLWLATSRRPVTHTGQGSTTPSGVLSAVGLCQCENGLAGRVNHSTAQLWFWHDTSSQPREAAIAWLNLVYCTTDILLLYDRYGHEIDYCCTTAVRSVLYYCCTIGKDTRPAPHNGRRSYGR